MFFCLLIFPLVKVNGQQTGEKIILIPCAAQRLHWQLLATFKVECFLACYSMHELMSWVNRHTLNINMTTLTILFVFIGSLAWHTFQWWLDLQGLRKFHEFQPDYANCEYSVSSLGEKVLGPCSGALRQHYTSERRSGDSVDQSRDCNVSSSTFSCQVSVLGHTKNGDSREWFYCCHPQLLTLEMQKWPF